MFSNDTIKRNFDKLWTFLWWTFQTLVARSEHDAVVQSPNGELQFLTIKALNEWDSKLANGVEWRQKLDIQRGAVLANELRNNACKLAKWTVQALLAGSDQIKFGFGFSWVFIQCPVKLTLNFF